MRHLSCNFAPHQRDGVRPLLMIYRAAGPMYGGSLMESGFEPGTRRPEVETLPLDHHVPEREQLKRAFQRITAALLCFPAHNF
ncbi:hypothetical protein AVEN_200228-1 [Araneus ventricosus]|uniref:Uncharacterized protein n=1 Tax=Araneus ventricosus TaxID=182803 RepID=A0A4Y2DK33_ARAVE|nr:hypothetical protein AVEN_200228-1 [Araneus ventricosus]